MDLACAAVFLHARDCSHSAVCDRLVSGGFARDSLDSLIHADHRPVGGAATHGGLHNSPLSERQQRRWTSYGNGGAKECHKVRQELFERDVAAVMAVHEQHSPDFSLVRAKHGNCPCSWWW